MVHDPRITTLLSRLGGLYRDPNRLDRDASSLLKSSVGTNLNPGIAPLFEDNGDSAHCLVLQGTIAIVFRGNTYQLLVDIYLPGGYPMRPPVSYVRLADNMYLKENHPHVGRDGMVYMPYTHEWNARTHSLIEMVVAMSSIFSADPPVFTKPQAPAPAPPPPAYHPPDEDYISPAQRQQDSESERYMQEQIALIAKREEEEKKRAEEERKQQIALQKSWEDKKKRETRDRLCQKTQLYLTQLEAKTQREVQSDWRDQQQLEHNKKTIEREIKHLQEAKDKLEQAIETVDAKTDEIKEWLQESKDGNNAKKEIHVDDICKPVTKLHAQMLALSAENAALTDALYFLDRGMYMGQIDCSTHLKMVRNLAKRQFRVRALLIKINQVLLKNNSY